MELRHLRLGSLRLLHRQIGDRLNNPLEVFLAHRMQIRIRRGIHKVDRVRNPILHGELHRVQVVAKGPAQLQRVLFHLLQQLLRRRRGILHIPLRMRPPRIVVHDAHLLLSHHVAPKILREVHRLLQHHAQITALVVRLEKLFSRMHVIHVSPAAPIHRFQK
jgi:hypothetical protein